MQPHSMKNFRIAILTLAVAMVAVACKKEFDTPPERILPTGQVMTVAQLRSLYTGVPKRFGGDSSVYAVVTADEQNGNLYKNIYIQDHTGAIVMRLLNSGGLYQGDSIRIYLPGTVLGSYAGMLQLDSVDVDNNVVKQATLVNKEPETVTLSQINSSLQGRLVRIENVEFALGEACNGVTYADAANQATVNRTLTDCSSSVIVRTSGYANFAGQPIARGKGTFVGVVGQFNNDMQLFIRNVNEVQLNDLAGRCDPCPTLCDPVASVNQDFASGVANVDLSLPCWNNQPQVGTRRWRGTAVSSDICAQATAFQSSAATDITWLISPPVNLTPGMTLNFRSQRGFGVAGHDPFGLFVSTNYNIGNVATANWTPVPCNYATASTPDQQWVESGAVDLSAALPAGYSGSFVVGFRYTGSGTNAQTTNFRIDNVVIQ